MEMQPCDLNVCMYEILGGAHDGMGIVVMDFESEPGVSAVQIKLTVPQARETVQMLLGIIATDESADGDWARGVLSTTGINEGG